VSRATAATAPLDPISVGRQRLARRTGARIASHTARCAFRRHLAIASLPRRRAGPAVGAAAQSPFDIALEGRVAAMRANRYRRRSSGFVKRVAAAPDNLLPCSQRSAPPKPHWVNSTRPVATAPLDLSRMARGPRARHWLASRLCRSARPPTGRRGEAAASGHGLVEFTQ